MRKFVYIAVIALGCIFQTDSFAVQYGDLYGVEWCPCNPDDQYDQNGSVVLGKTVMCPCDSMYEGYDRTMEKDLRKVQHKVKQKVEQAKNFKYYVGFDFYEAGARLGIALLDDLTLADDCFNNLTDQLTLLKE